MSSALLGAMEGGSSDDGWKLTTVERMVVAAAVTAVFFRCQADRTSRRMKAQIHVRRRKVMQCTTGRGAFPRATPRWWMKGRTGGAWDYLRQCDDAAEYFWDKLRMSPRVSREIVEALLHFLQHRVTFYREPLQPDQIAAYALYRWVSGETYESSKCNFSIGRASGLVSVLDVADGLQWHRADMYGGDEVSALVIDVGSNTCKAGYAGEDAPKAVFPSLVGVVEKSGAADGSAAALGNGDVEMGDAEEKRTGNKPGGDGNDKARKANRKLYVNALGFRRDFMEVVPTVKEGLVADWDLVEGLWEHAFRERLLVDPREHPMLLAEPSQNTNTSREKTVELMFEKHQVPALFLGKNAVLTSFASGRATSLVVDSGGGSTTVAAVHDGYVLQKAIVRSPIGGDALTEAMLNTVESMNVMIKPRYSFKRTEVRLGEFEVTDLDLPNTTQSYRRYQQRCIAADIKESVCRVADSTFEEKQYQNIPTQPYELPDGNIIEIGADRFRIPEIIFNPSILKSIPGMEKVAEEQGRISGLPTMVLESINKCDADIRRELFSGILLAGGNAVMTQMKERLEKELMEEAPQAARVKVISSGNNIERRFRLGNKMAPNHANGVVLTQQVKATEKAHDDLTIVRSEKLQPKPALEGLQFGRVFTDHMLQQGWSREKGWGKPIIKPVSNLELHPCAQVLHYGLECFEGMKAYKDAEGHIRLFRPMMNINRLSSSASRLSFGELDKEYVLECLKELLRLEHDWIPSQEGYSLYIRPTIIATAAMLGVSAPAEALLYVMLSPVGPYYPSGMKPIKLFVDLENARAWPGGIVEDGLVGESGAMNVFFLLRSKGGALELVTPPLDGTILPGVTRDSVLSLCRTWGEFSVSERPVRLRELVEASQEGRLVEIFGTGTACIVQPVEGLRQANGQDLLTPFNNAAASYWMNEKKGKAMETPKEGEPFSLCGRLTRALLDIQHGRVEHSGWSVLVE
ncbi:hypothetical protein CBR_g46675 [Chara braunii]|uniref:Branched-chain-amino-acid aminotransferase n=1 Tax=Chara braunii TaxID=69332 RepID=A0A388M0W3_CHABU|nr:hypothetical protein CBR_g46675 [Chara braunii]|eukprot:GBG88186.1 hypothetical protein CBR_g46675 [Chara braunii]